MNIISPRQHGYIDLIVVVAFALAPVVIGLDGAAAIFSYVVAVVHLAMTIVTVGLPVALRGAIPLALHGLVEMGVGVVLGLVGWLAFEGAARNFFLVMAAVILAVFAVTAYQPGD